MSHSLSRADLQNIEAAQRILLAPLQYDEIGDWQAAVAGSVQDVMQADHAYSFLPAGEDDISLAGHDLDPDFYEGIRMYFETASNGALAFDDPMPLNMHRARLQSGPGVYHELDISSRSTIENAPSYHALFAPHGAQYVTGLSVPFAAGEATLCLAFESSDAEGYDPAAGARLRLLLPAFEAGLEQWQRLGPTRDALTTLIDTLSEAVVLFDADAHERHRNGALVDLLATEPAADTLMRLARSIATSDPNDLLPARRTAELENGTYTLRAGHAPLHVFDAPGTLVTIERDSPYPSPPVLQTRFGLTPREAEVALLLARGRSNEALAEQLFISPHTARHHVQQVMKKLAVPSRSGVGHALLQADGSTH